MHESHLPSRLVTVGDYDHNPLEIATLPKYKTTKNTNNQLYIITFNVRTLSSYHHLLELEEAIRQIKYDIIGISEMRRFGNKIEEYDTFILCYIGTTPGKYGVGFIVKKSLKHNIESFIGTTERVATLNLNFQGYKLSVIQVYAPTDAASETEIDEFYMSIIKVMETAHKNIILMGDFNAKIGVPRLEEYLVMKQHGYGKRNDRGQRLVDFALENKLTIINTCFKKKQSRRWTWQSPNGKHKNEIDFIMSNQPKIFQNIETINMNYPSDHRPIRATIKLSKHKRNRAKFTFNHKSSLNTDEEIIKYNESLELLLSNPIPLNTSIQLYYDKLINVINQSLQYARKENHNKKLHKILSSRTTKLLQRRRELQKTKNKTRTMKNELSALYKLANKYIKKDYENYRLETIQRNLQQLGSTKKAFKELRAQKTWIEGLKKTNKNLHNRKDIMTTATEFYRDLYSDKNGTITEININNEVTLCETNIEPIDEIEIIDAIKKLKVEKSPGSDNITNEAVKLAQKALAGPLTKLFNLILQNSETPVQWSESNIILIYKKGDSKDISNYRPISLLPVLYKLFSSIINRRISITLEAKQPVEQAGFRKGFSTVDHIHTLELIIEKYQERQRPLYVAFVDYQKAFDTVSHSSIWESLREQEVADKYIKVIRSIYNNNSSRVKLETIGPSFPIKRGVRQGDPLSPTLFIAILEHVISKLDWKYSGINIQGMYLSHLRFADDLVLLSESSSQLQHMIHSLHSASVEVGLEINVSKTMAMTNSEKRPIIINNNPLEYTENYIYLGKRISFDKNSNDREIERRIQLTWNKYWSMKEIFKSKVIPINIKTKVMNSNLLPCLTYGCQTWKFTSKIKNKLNVCQRALERSMLNIRKIDKIRHTKIRNITKVTNALSYAQKLKWKWAGHVARLTDSRWTVITTRWNGPQGKRCKGRPKTRWEDDIKSTAGPLWLKLSQDRETWKSLEEAYTRKGVPD